MDGGSSLPKPTKGGASSSRDGKASVKQTPRRPRPVEELARQLTAVLNAEGHDAAVKLALSYDDKREAVNQFFFKSRATPD